MDIAITPAEIEDGVSTHVEHSPTNFLSILANLTPFSDFNQVISILFCAYMFMVLMRFNRVHATSINVRYEDV